MSSFWNQWIIGLTILNIIGILWLLTWTRKQSPKDIGEHETCGHSYDGIEEYNRPLPRWWLNLFYIMIIFGCGYLLLYPGLGNFAGAIGWTSGSQWRDEVTMVDNRYADIYAEYAKVPIEELLNYPEPLKVGQRLFANNCSTCHGADAKGAKGFPNLTDNDWLYGGSPAEIKQSLLQGRMGNMPGFSGAFNKDQIIGLAHYVRSLSGNSVDEVLVVEGKALFQSTCSGCHGKDGKGNQMLGAPNLTDTIWLYGGSLDAIIHTLTEGRQGQMPRFTELLGEHKIHTLAAYVYSLSNESK